jgi:hypothetical protein
MKKAATTSVLLSAAALALATPAFAASPDIVISQVYGGGGNSGATLTHDFIELFNRGGSAVSLDGWSLQYASATGTGNFGATETQITLLPAVVVQPGQYFLVQQAQGTGGSQALPTPDLTDATPINMSGTSGKVALATTDQSLGCNGGSTPCSPEQLALIKDLVGYGSANFFEGAGPAAGTSNTTAAHRNDGGCTDTDNNGGDFTILGPTPRNTSTAQNPCVPVQNTTSTWGRVKTLYR